MKNTLKLLLSFGIFLTGILQMNAQNCNRYVDGDSAKTTAPYSIYREFFKKNLISEAYPYWKQIYTKAPLFRLQTMMDGEAIYTKFIQDATDKSLKEKYADTLFALYDKRIQCFGQEDYVLGKKAIDALKYKGNTAIPDARAWFEKSLKISGATPYPFVVQTYFKLLVNQVGNGDITTEFVKGKYDELSVLVDKGIAKNDKNSVAFKEVKTLMDEMYAQNFADKSDPADCAKLMEIYKKRYNEKPNDLENIKTVYNKVRSCNDSLFNVELLKKLNNLEPSYTYAIRLGNLYMKNKKFDSAYILYQNAVLKESDSTKKADLFYIMASLKADKDDFPAARDLAKQALLYSPTMGKASLLIGTLYAASGKMCGPGVGFQSQIVLWPAFDYFKKAKEDPATAEEAQKMISSYTKYLPTTGDIKTKGLSQGQTYKIGCWINETTTVQAIAGPANSANAPKTKTSTKTKTK